jgi:hypothetical protein
MLAGCKRREAGPVLIATIALPEDRRGKDYCDYDFQTERFFLKSSISHDLIAGDALLAVRTGWRCATCGYRQVNESAYSVETEIWYNYVNSVF